jgi:CBS domain-containing protein
MQMVPINTYDSPNVVLDLIYALKVKDVMTPQPVRADEGTTIREIRTLLKERGITGIPITEGNELRGMVSISSSRTMSRQGCI